MHAVGMKLRPRRLISLFVMSNLAIAPFSSASAVPPKVDVNRASQMIQISPGGDGAVKASMILLHGLGDTAHGWAGAAHEMVQHVEGLRVVLPTAPSQPVTLNGGFKMPSWYDIKGLDDRSNEDCDGLDETRSYVLGLIENEARTYPDAKIILGGFSQGGAVSLYTGLQHSGKPRLAGVLCMSGYLPDPKNWELSEAGRETPVMMRHGDADDVVALWMAEKSIEKIQAAGLANTIEWKTYPMGHSAVMEEIEDVIAWIKSLLR